MYIFLNFSQGPTIPLFGSINYFRAADVNSQQKTNKNTLQLGSLMTVFAVTMTTRKSNRKSSQTKPLTFPRLK
jgi:hypothetical protein